MRVLVKSALPVLILPTMSLETSSYHDDLFIQLRAIDFNRRKPNPRMLGWKIFEIQPLSWTTSKEKRKTILEKHRSHKVHLKNRIGGSTTPHIPTLRPTKIASTKRPCSRKTWARPIHTWQIRPKNKFPFVRAWEVTNRWQLNCSVERVL